MDLVVLVAILLLSLSLGLAGAHWILWPVLYVITYQRPVIRVATRSAALVKTAPYEQQAPAPVLASAA
jgi:hypothetical protein